MQEFAKRSAQQSAADFKADKTQLVQEQVFVEIKKILQKAKLYLKTSIDTVQAQKELLSIQADAEIAGDGVFNNTGTAHTYRNLTATSKILSALLKRGQSQKNSLDNHKQQLSNLKYKLDSLSSIKELFEFPTDSVQLSKYMQGLRVLAYEVTPIDSALTKAISSTQLLQNQTNLELFKLENSHDEANLYLKGISGQLSKKEFANIWESTGYFRPIDQIFKQAIAKGKLNLLYFVQSNVTIIGCTLLLFIICFTYLRSLKKMYEERELLKDDLEGQLVLRYPFLSALVIITNLSQFLFGSSPFIFSLIFWVVSALSLSILFRGFITKYWMMVWLLLLSLFMLAALDNLILQATRLERWLMIVLALMGVITGLIVFKTGKRNELKEKLILYSIGLMFFLELISLIANVFGSYNFAKALLVAGYLNVVIAIMFLWTVRLINEGIKLAFSIYTKQDKKLFYVNFERVGQDAPILLYLLLVIGWFILFGRNFPEYSFLIEPLRGFFSDERTLGSYTFTINNLLLFVLILSISVLVSKVVSFFATDQRTSSKQDHNTRKGLGSWILLIRIAIIVLGLFLAFASAGIPMDKIAIVLGALGVGIGFGLQSLVNNLVSGLIIAFEKPVNLGDMVEIAGKDGTVKSIGFRSSIISTYDGAEIVMPNGDLLNSHLVNWSTGAHKRRTAIVLQLTHDSDLEKIRDILLKLLATDERVLSHPEPLVLFQDFKDNRIEMKLFYWTKQLKDVAEVKSDLIVGINKVFAKHAIVLSLPQQDIYIHGADGKKST
ncbi:mechanosensitive ion channel protein [Pedobacter sp. Hv1]|nr:mechanosensitive ion channel protein [Pedobacter sp. Hv1]